MNPIMKIADRLIRFRNDLIPQFRADGLSVSGRNLTFLDEISPAWDKVLSANKSLRGGVPDIRWRSHVALWAARHAMSLEGDLVECGVFTGILATVICETIRDLGSKQYWLFDTFEGIPVETVSAAERRNSEALNNNFYNFVDAESIVRNAIGHNRSIRIVKGILPESLSRSSIDKISYLSIDLNNVARKWA